MSGETTSSKCLHCGRPVLAESPLWLGRTVDGLLVGPFHPSCLERYRLSRKARAYDAIYSQARLMGVDLSTDRGEVTE